MFVVFPFPPPLPPPRDSIINYREPQDGDTALHLASIQDKDEMIKFLLNLDANPNLQDLKGEQLSADTRWWLFEFVEFSLTSISFKKFKI